MACRTGSPSRPVAVGWSSVCSRPSGTSESEFAPNHSPDRRLAPGGHRDLRRTRLDRARRSWACHPAGPKWKRPKPYWWPRPTSPSAPSSSRIASLAGLAGRRRPRELPHARRERRGRPGRRRRAPAAGHRPADHRIRSVVKPGDRGFLAAVLEPGMRAISVPIDEAAGNAGLVLPGRPCRPDPDPDHRMPRATRRERAA